jgi:hypothetical protein
MPFLSVLEGHNHAIHQVLRILIRGKVVARVEQALRYISDNFNAFPTFQALPAANEMGYGGGLKRKYGAL